VIFTHTPATLAIYLGGAGKVDRLGLFVLAFASMLPDLDHFLPPALDASRVYLHNLPFLAVLVAVALPISRTICAQLAAGVGSHILIDLADHGGVALLFPFTRENYGLGLWNSPEPSFTTLRGLPTDLSLAALFIAILVIIAWVRRRRGERP
jgi:membrane-bound metal-dependent hydrolase YbcI (DUF457 family)